ETEPVTVAQIAQSPAQRKIKRAHRIVRPRVGFIEPIIDSTFAVPAFSDRIGLDTCAAAQCAPLLNRTNHPTPLPLHHVVPESVTTDFFHRTASVAHELALNKGSAKTP